MADIIGSLQGRYVDCISRVSMLRERAPAFLASARGVEDLEAEVARIKARLDELKANKLAVDERVEMLLNSDALEDISQDASALLNQSMQLNSDVDATRHQWVQRRLELHALKGRQKQAQEAAALAAAMITAASQHLVQMDELLRLIS